MKKLFLIGLKDVKVAFRDRAALILMLLAPFLLTLGLGAVTGRFSGRSSNGISHIPVILVNQDQQELGQDLVFVFQSPELDELIDANVYNDTVAADRLVDENKAVAVILIPEGFTASIIPPEGQMTVGPLKQIELYTNPTAPTSVGVVKTILDEFMSQVEVGRAGGTVTVTQLIASGRLTPQQAQAIAAGAGADQANAARHSSSIRLNNVTSTGEEVKFDVLALLAPSMAMMFLMYTVSNGGRTLLTERNQGTLPRLLVSPTTSVQVLGGKMIGIFLTGSFLCGVSQEPWQLIAARARSEMTRRGIPYDGKAFFVTGTAFGDAVMAWFNAPIPQPDHTLRAVRAALSMHDAINGLHRELPPESHLHFGVGIHLGDAVLGLIGTEKRLDYTAIGDSVNTAKRIQENAGRSQILISQPAYERVADCIQVRAVGPIKAKGKSEPVQVYEVLELCS